MTLSWKTAKVKSSHHAVPRPINPIVDGTPSNVPPRTSPSCSTPRHFPPGRSNQTDSDYGSHQLARGDYPPLRPVDPHHSICLRSPVRQSLLRRLPLTHRRIYNQVRVKQYEWSDKRWIIRSPVRVLAGPSRDRRRCDSASGGQRGLAKSTRVQEMPNCRSIGVSPCETKHVLEHKTRQFRQVTRRHVDDCS
jgi:hypothetical protein